MFNRRNIIAGGIALGTSALVGASSQAQSRTQRSCNVSDKDAQPQYRGQIRGLESDHSIMQAERRFDLDPQSMRSGNGAKPVPGKAKGTAIIKYSRASALTPAIYVTDVWLMVGGFLYDRAIGFDELGTVSLGLYKRNGDLLATIPVYSDIYDGDPAVDRPLYFDTFLSYGAEGGIGASKADKQSFVTRIMTEIEMSGGELYFAALDPKKGDGASGTLAKIDWNVDVHAVKVDTANRLSQQINAHRAGNC